MESQMLDVYTVVLSDGGKEKKVVLREMQMEYEENAVRAIGNKAGDNQAQFGLLYQNEVLKALIVEVDGVKLTGLEKENLKKLFTYKELIKLRKVIAKITGTDDVSDPKLEFSRISGDK